MSLKRRRTEDAPFQDEPADLIIITTDSEQPIEAHLAGLRLFSRVVDDLPRAASGGQTTWDLSKLVLEGQSSPVPSAVVRQWLDLVYSRVDAGRRAPKFTSLSEAARSLLLFADAVGTRAIAMKALVETLTAQPGLTLPVVVNGTGAGAGGPAAGGGGGNAAPPQPLQLELALRGKLYYLAQDGPLGAVDVPRAGAKACLVVAASELAPHTAALPGAVAGALEGWLYLAGRLGLVALVRLLLEFYKAQLVPATISLLNGVTLKVFSRRVLECMPLEVMWEGFMRGCVCDASMSQVDVVDGGTIPKVALTAPHVAAWYSSKLDHTAVDIKLAATTFAYNGTSLPAWLSVGGLPPPVLQAELAEAMQRLEEDEPDSTY
ncbi:hypothetical protein HXX76_003970 [Chlamydomonas incerta]|uniref:BTB domain-containing protein n=1 Tax=Chlamydomonas incerta TaxID=51695 RepID=A0A835W882_CHLIN|nr:hypothetical protein HXX76_003970 [Chlamydomonas incerta]|eukprot:KAG2441118.1 hypothetical protein HXX76_003970 [Chlamydomonas incerta]